MRICRVKSADITEIRRLLIKTWRDTYRLPPDKIRRSNGRGDLLLQAEDPKTVFLCARDKIRITGVITLVRQTADKVLLGRLYVLPSCQRRGIGTKLFQAGLKKIPGVKKIILNAAPENYQGINFYLKKGFKIKGLRWQKCGCFDYRVYLMEKLLEGPPMI